MDTGEFALWYYNQTGEYPGAMLSIKTEDMQIYASVEALLIIALLLNDGDEDE